MRLETAYFFARQFKQRNARRKQTSSGRDLVIYCGETRFVWHPGRTDTHLGGSEEALINLAPALVKLGWNVTIYNNCGQDPVFSDGVLYRPYWEFNALDKQDVVVLWRNAKPADAGINAERIFLDLHDTVPKRRIGRSDWARKLTGVFVKSRFHRSLYPTIPDKKMIVIPNGLDFRLLDGDVQKDPFLIINTSSPDRSMGVLPQLFGRIRERVPEARLQWAYSWDLFRLFNAQKPERMDWMKQRQREMDEVGIKSLGWLSHSDVGQLYRRAAIFGYPTNVAEIDCISVRKAQACGCVPVTSDAGALIDSVQFGIKVPCEKGDVVAKAKSRHPYGGLWDTNAQQAWVDAVVDLLEHPEKRIAMAEGGQAWARQFSWTNIAARWHAVLSGEAPHLDAPAHQTEGAG